MAKQDSDQKTATLARIRRTEAYAEKVRLLFAKTVNDILALNKTMPSLDEGVMFSFDGESVKKQKEVEVLLRRLHSAVTMAIQQGVKLEWDAANQECDKLVQSIFGKKVLESPEFSAWMGRNTEARDAFLSRSEHGLNLSDRVWKSVRQLRDEMEVAMTISIGEGESSSSMSRKVRQYLNNPDDMFRRFRYKKGEKDIIDPETGEITGKEIVYGKKWKKRIKDEVTGKYKWVDYDRDSYKTGAGVYKSSARNAMRVARTETNIAYRRADNARWQDMDFVLGQRVQLSKNHPEKDICDKLQGDYPKDFVFDGWHPQCFCFATPILMDESEMAKVTEAFLKGEKYTPRGKQITDYPAAFKDWVKDHAEDIAASRERGTEPYFIRNNAQAIDEILNPKAKKKTALEIAQERHAARTPEQEQAIRLKARRRASAMRSAETYIKDFKGFEGVDTSALEDAYKHARWDEVRSEALKFAQKKRGIIESGIDISNELSGIKDIDMTAIQDAIKNDKLNIIKTQIDALTKMKNEILALSNIDNPLDVAKQFSMKDAITVNGKIQEFFNRYSWDFSSETNLEKLRKGLEHEITWMETKGRKYATWEVSRDAYKKRLALVNKRIEMKKVETDFASHIDELKKTRNRSKVADQLLTEFETLFADDNTDINVLRQKALDIKDKAEQLIHKREIIARMKAKKAGKASTSGVYIPKSEAEVKKDYKDYMKSIGVSISDSEIVIDDGFVHMQGTQHQRIYNGNSIETPAEHAQLWNSVLKTQRSWRSGYVRTSNSFRINGDFRATGVVGKLDPSSIAKLKAHGMTDDDVKTCKLLDKKIDEFSLPFPILVTRYVEFPALDNIFGRSIIASTKKGYLGEVNKSANTMIQADPAYLSASTNENQNVFTSYPVKLQIEVPPHTHFYMTDNYVESEVVFGRSTKLLFKHARIEGSHLVLRCMMIP